MSLVSLATSSLSSSDTAFENLCSNRGGPGNKAEQRAAGEGFGHGSWVASKGNGAKRVPFLGLEYPAVGLGARTSSRQRV